jgi:type I restriction enzyme M protein
MLTWIMFLKFLDDMEQVREQEALMSGKRFRPTIEPPYRWRDWTAKADGITGDELISFVNNEEVLLGPDNTGPGLFAFLRNLQGSNGGDRRDVVATVFKGTINRMINGYLLRDVINKVNGVHFTSSEEIHTLGHFYESMLKEMRDAAGDSGEFYTPRAVVRFMVTVTDPRLGETLLDPACGTGGFLAEAYQHLEKQCKTVENRKTLQQKSVFGGEAKPLPYLLAQMNLLLHGLEYPRIDYGNSLRFKITEIGDRDRVDIILTNPQFGGEEERGILSNFPDDKQTSETALLFLQLIMRKLRRSPKPGRAGVVVPNGTLFGDGVCARIKEQLLKEFNLHTVVRLPNGVFAPYTSIPTNRCSLTAPDQRATCDSTSSRCRKDGRTTPRRSRCSSRTLPAASTGGRSGRRTTGHGRSRRTIFSRTTATSTSRTRTARRTRRTCRRRSWWRASSKRSNAFSRFSRTSG